MKLSQSLGMSTNNNKTNLIIKVSIILTAALSVAILVLSSNFVIKIAQAQQATVPSDSCFDFDTSTGTIVTYYDHESGDPGNSACPKAVDIPSQIDGVSVAVIGDNAFQDKTLTYISIPSSVNSIGIGAFSNNQLTSVTIPDSVTTIWQAAFSNNQLTSVTIPDSVTSIGAQAFFNNQLTSVIIPDNVKAIESRAFFSNPLVSFHMGDGLTNSSVFSSVFDKSMLEEVHIGNGITEIPSGAFYGAKLKSVHIPNSVTSIGTGAFSGNQLTSVIIPDNVTTIWQAAFSGNQLTSVIIPDRVITIWESAFSDNQLTSVTLGSGLTSIAGGAFSNNQLTSVIIPDNVKAIESGAFSNNPITFFHIGNGITDNSFLNHGFAKDMLEEIHIGSGITEIPSGAFYGAKLKSVHIPNNVTSIGTSAFSYNQLTSVTLGSGLTSLTGEEGFARQATYEVDIDGWPIASTFSPLPMLTRIYTSDQSNPHNLQDLLECGDLFTTGDNICLGYLINPTQATVSFESSSGSNLRETMTLTGQMPDGTTLTNYSREFIEDLMLNQNYTLEEVSGLFFRLSDTIELPQLPTIAGYQAPPVQSLALSSVDTPVTLIYLSNEQVDQGYSWNEDGSIVAPASASENEASIDDSASLADTGVSQWGVVGLGVMSLIAGLFGARSLRKKHS